MGNGSSNHNKQNILSEMIKLSSQIAITKWPHFVDYSTSLWNWLSVPQFHPSVVGVASTLLQAHNDADITHHHLCTITSFQLLCTFTYSFIESLSLLYGTIYMLQIENTMDFSAANLPPTETANVGGPTIKRLPQEVALGCCIGCCIGWVFLCSPISVTKCNKDRKRVSCHSLVQKQMEQTVPLAIIISSNFN